MNKLQQLHQLRGQLITDIKEAFNSELFFAVNDIIKSIKKVRTVAATPTRCMQ